MNAKRTLTYIAEWFLPSCTAFYIILNQNILWGTVDFGGYPVNIPSYLLACTAAAIIFYPINKYIFKRGDITIYINNVPIIVENGEYIRVGLKSVSKDNEKITYKFKDIGI